MFRFNPIYFVSAIAFLFITVCAHARQPNIIIILSDDHGYTDLGIHGIDPNVQTPAMDALAAKGALMKYGYSTAPQCVPSRAGLMSGRIQNTFGTSGNGAKVPIPRNVPTIAERLKELGSYRTGFVGKWHLGGGQYAPSRRGFDDYHNGTLFNYTINYTLDGEAIQAKPLKINENRVLYQGKAGAAFIEKNHDQPFFLYLSLYGPHTPLIKKSDPYYLNFPKLDYPNYSDEIDDIRRRGLGLIKAVDDAVARVMNKLREHGLEENTLILFAGDNGAQPKYWNAVNGKGTLDRWDGSENIPLRGEKGSLWEGGIKVPMFAYWKGKIQPGQVIKESASTLDFIATTIVLAGGEIPPEFDGADLLPRLTGRTDSIERKKPLFWSWGREAALQEGDWKVHRIGKRYNLFNLKKDPNEFYDLKLRHPEKFQHLKSTLMATHDALPKAGQSPFNNKAPDLYLKGAPKGVPADPRFTYPYDEAQPFAYPAPLKTLPIK